MQEKIRLNVGCGYEKLDGWINTDINKKVNPDKIWDIEKKSNFSSNSVDEIYIKHTFQYAKNPIQVLKEFHRICKPNALITIIVPHCNAYQDNLFHPVMGFNQYSFDKFCKQGRSYYDLPKFKIEKVRCRSNGIVKLIPFKKLLSTFLNNIYFEIEYKLRVIKD